MTSQILGEFSFAPRRLQRETVERLLTFTKCIDSGPRATMSVGNDRSRGRYSVDLAWLRDGLGGGLEGHGWLSPEDEVNLSSADRVSFQIPGDATRVCFAYPLPDEELLDRSRLKTADEDEALYEFITFGGFVYWDMLGQPVAVNALRPGEGLRLLEGRRVKTGAACALHDELAAERCLERVTIESIHLCGLTQFCWIGPGRLISRNAAVLDAPLGAFVYFGAERSDCQCRPLFERCLCVLRRLAASAHAAAGTAPWRRARARRAARTRCGEGDPTRASARSPQPSDAPCTCRCCPSCSCLCAR